MASGCAGLNQIPQLSDSTQKILDEHTPSKPSSRWRVTLQRISDQVLDQGRATSSFDDPLQHIEPTDVLLRKTINTGAIDDEVNTHKYPERG